MNEAPRSLAEQLAAIARELIVAGDVVATLQRIVELAVDTIEGCDHAGISLVVGERIETPAQSDEVPGRIDGLMVAAGEGPSLDAIREQESFITGDIAEEQRWTNLSTEVVEQTGVHSLLSMRLFVEAATLGSLNLYAKTVDAFDDDDRSMASIFAAHAAVALRAAQRQEQLTEATESLDADVIGVAKGLIMAQHDIGEAAAMQVLRDASTRTNRGLRTVADDILDAERND